MTKAPSLCVCHPLRLSLRPIHSTSLSLLLRSGLSHASVLGSLQPQADVRESELRGKQPPESAAALPAAGAAQAKPLEHLVAGADEREASHAGRLLERAPLEFHPAQLGAAERSDRPLDRRRVRGERDGGRRGLCLCCAGGVEDAEHHVHNHHRDARSERQVGRGGESPDGEPQRSAGGGGQAEGADKRRARQPQPDAPVEEEAEATGEGCVEGELSRHLCEQVLGGAVLASRALAIDDDALSAEQVQRLHQRHHRHVDGRVREQRHTLGDLGGGRGAEAAEDLAKHEGKPSRHAEPQPVHPPIAPVLPPRAAQQQRQAPQRPRPPPALGGGAERGRGAGGW
mmetsp:Transcript_35893/g.115440  ORF Transcript_35893/g.115440 Transcript_35893/m.115440 type:complete len:342 (-) Transcript_35893:78-1103(-)